MKKALLILAVLALAFSWQIAFAEEKDFPKQKIVEIAVKSVQEQGIVLKEVRIIYDEGGKLWLERIGALGAVETKNHGILKMGFVKNYRIVYFDFKEPLKDVWVFVDKDSGEVLTVYREE
ncbi:MAG: hypothetical protein NTW13_05700 [Candidatus Omnitrophica bacterium]|nr:hypothetical protein [Candidatus Omnitrophota bacterium]